MQLDLSFLLRLLASIDGYKTYLGVAIVVLGAMLGSAEMISGGSALAGAGLAHKLQKLIDAVKVLVEAAKDIYPDVVPYEQEQPR